MTQPQPPKQPRHASFSTPRLILRSPRIPSDVPSCLARVHDKSVVQHLPHLLSREHTAETCATFLQSCLDSSGIDSFFLIYERKSDGAVIGDGGFESLSLEGGERRGDAGLMLDNSAEVRGKGYAEEGMGATIEWGLRSEGEGGLGLDVVRMYTREENGGFRGLMGRLGIGGIEHVGEGGVREVMFEVRRDGEAWKNRTWSYLR